MMPSRRVQAVVMRDRAAWIQWLLEELDRLEAMAAAAQPSEVHHFGWAGLSSESGLTEAQEDLVDAARCGPDMGRAFE
jgi:hypothetical protein